MNNDKSNMGNSVSYREIMANNEFFIATPVGTSMMPMIRERIDTIKLVKVDRKLQKYDVILYERPDQTYVLHRIVGVKRGKGEESYILCGDNQTVLEKNVSINQVIAVMEGYYRGEEYIEYTNASYMKYAKRCVRSRKWRKIRHFLGRIYHKIFKRKK